VAEPARTFVLAAIDQGTRNVGGREGSRLAPERLLAGLEKRGLVEASDRIRELDVENTPASLERDLDTLSDAVQEVLETGRQPVVLGGDHGTTYATVRGAARVLEIPGIAYLDVHLDVRDYRPEHTSGSSFRRLIEEGHVDPARVRPVGIEVPGSPQEREASDFGALAAWAREHGISYLDLDEVREDPRGALRDVLDPPGNWCLSLDVDVLDEAFAPGVSAPGEGRLSLEDARQAVRATRNRFEALDVAEYAPPLDEEDRTLESALILLEAALGEP